MLFVPTSNVRVPKQDHMALPVSRGQLYNLDNNEKLDFQHNPETFEWVKEWKWTEVSYRGRRFGRDLHFSMEDSAEFDLPLLYVCDPAAPDFGYAGPYQIFRGKGDIDFTEMLRLINTWQGIQPGTRRPSRLMVILNGQTLPGGMMSAQSISFEGVVTKINHRILDSFETGDVREAMFIFSFREWIPHVIR